LYLTFEGDKGIPRRAAGVHDVVVCIEDSSGQIVLAQILPDIFLRVEFGAVGRQAQEGDVFRHDEFVALLVPACAVDHDDGMSALGHMTADLRKVPVHGIRVCLGQDERHAGVTRRTNGTENIGAFVSLVERLPRP